jgi:hypothetical protein
MATSWESIVLDYVCPSIGGVMSSIMFAGKLFSSMLYFESILNATPVLSTNTLSLSAIN